MNNFQNNVLNFRRGYLEDPGSNEPTFLTFSIDFNFLSQLNPTLGLMSSPLFDTYTKNGAYQYLIARGYEYQANCLLKFIKKLIDISETQPWFFQSIAGLDTLWAAGTDMNKPYKGKDKVVTVETLESLDLSITYLADMYRQSIYDIQYMRELVPENLRRFQVDVYVAEFRNLIINPEVPTDTPDYSFFNNYKTHTHYVCSMCEFDFSKSVPFKDNLNVFKPEMSTNRFSFKPARFIEKNSYNLQGANKIQSAVVGEVKQTSLHGTSNDNGRNALNTFEKDDFTKVSLNDMLYGARRVSDVYHGIESGEYLNNFINNNPISAAVNNIKYELDETAAYIRSNINKPVARESVNNLPDDHNKITTYADIENSRKSIFNKNEKDDVIIKKIDEEIKNPDKEKPNISKPIIDRTVYNKDEEKTINNVPYEKPTEPLNPFEKSNDLI